MKRKDIVKLKEKVKAWCYKEPTVHPIIHIIAIALATKYIIVNYVKYFSMFALGLLAPTANIDNVLAETSAEVTNLFFYAFENMFKTGQQVAIDNPLIAKVVASLIGYCMWTLMFGLFAYVFQFTIRSVISSVLHKPKKGRKK